MNSSNNQTLASFETYEDFGQDLMILFLYSLTTILSLFGNTIVCYVVFSNRISTTTYILIGNLALSDILGAITIPGQWLFCSEYVMEQIGDRCCGLTKSSQILSYYISTFTMTVIAYDRYRIVYYPLSIRIRPWKPICFIWIISSVFVLPTMVSMRVSQYFTANRLVYCKIVFTSSVGLFSTLPFRTFRVTFVIISQYLIPLSISVLLYALCVKKIISRKRIGVVTDQQFKDFYKSKRRTINMLTLSLFVFTIVWFPVHLIHFIDFYITPLLAHDCNSSIYYLFFYWLAISSCCFNPYIYCWFNKDFRSAINSSLFCRFIKNRPQNNCINETNQTKSSRQSSNTSSNTFFVNHAFNHR